jgi:hypothetical protein
MDYTTLTEITKAIVAVLQHAIDPFGVVKVEPELLRNNDLGVGFYLFHAQENAHYKNYPAPGKDNPPVNYTPMALNLFYQLSANWKVEDKEDAYEEQRLMSIAMKALHDNAIITTTTPGFAGGKKINIKITLQTLTPSESVQYWAAAESPVRLSAYYEVSAIFLEPEKPKSYAGRVLSYGNYVFVNNQPQLTSSENVIVYTVPGEITPRQVFASPAQTPPADTIPGAPINKLILKGNALSGGALELLIIHPRWKEAAIAKPADWELVRTADHTITVTVRETAELQKSAIPVDILPGLYAAQVSLKIIRVTPAGSKTFIQTSNQFPFLVAPRIDSISPTSGVGGDTFIVNVYRVQHAALLPEDVQVYLGEDQLIFNKSGGALDFNQFKITGAEQIELRARATLAKGLVPVRILINGVESTPHWITGL